MVKTMESINGQTSGFEMPYDNPGDLESDFSVISHPTTNEPPINVNYDHLQHLNFSGVNLEPPQPSHSHEEQSGVSISNSIIQQHLEQILKENMELKEALQQNNATLRQHFQTLITWQEQQTKARVRHKQMIDDMQQASLSVQREKESLLSKVEELKTQLDINSMELNQTLQTKDVVVAELTTQIEQRDVMNMQLVQELKETQADLEQIKSDKRELEKAKADTSTVNPFLVVDEDFGYSVVHHSGFNAENAKLEIERLEGTVEALQEGKALLMKLLSDREADLKELKQKLDESLEDLEKTKQELEQNRQSSPNAELPACSPDQQWVVMEAGIINSTTDFEAAASCLQKYGDRFSSVDQQLGECQRRLCESIRTESNTLNIEQLRDELEDLRLLLRAEQESKETDRCNLEESQLKFDTLHKEYKALMKQWHDFQSEMQTKSRQMEALSRIEKRQNQEQLDELTAKVMMQEEVITDKERDLSQFKNRMDILMRETEQIPILRAQVELFQQKLKKKDEDSKKSDSIIEAQKRDIHSLQAQVVQLMDEINHQNQSQVMQLSSQAQSRNSPIYERRASEGRGSCSAPHSRRQSAERHIPINTRPLSEQVEERTAEETVAECPKCRLVFRNLQAAENHVEECCFGPENMSNPFI